MRIGDSHYCEKLQRVVSANDPLMTAVLLPSFTHGPYPSSQADMSPSFFGGGDSGGGGASGDFGGGDGGGGGGD